MKTNSRIIVIVALFGSLSWVQAQNASPGRTGSMPKVSPSSGQTTNSWSDARIAQALERKLSNDPSVPGYLLDALVENGVVTLKGNANSLAEKRQAEKIASALRGVRAVKNQIQIEGKSNDAELKRLLALAFAHEAAAETSEINPGVKDGVITLSGEVDSFWEKEVAERIASNIKGVQEVRNKLSISFAESRSDADIEADIQSRLAWDSKVNADEITVEVVDGIVHLAGSVHSAIERDWAKEDAWVLGVKSVDSSGLIVLPVTEQNYATHLSKGRDETTGSGKAPAGITGQAGSSDSFQKTVRARLQQAVGVKLEPGGVELRNGILWLRGATSTLAQKNAATAAAAEIPGIKSVYNLLRVRPAKRLDNATLFDRVSAAIKRNPYLDEEKLKVTARNGKVWLEGKVDSWWERSMAYEAAARVQGVMAIQNNLAVQPLEVVSGHARTIPPHGLDPYAASDAEIQREIEEQMFWSPFVDADEVDVTVERHSAILTGTVDSLMEKRTAEKNAYDAGATEVHNRLRVGDPGLL